MRKTAPPLPPFTKNAGDRATIAAPGVSRLIDAFLMAGDINRHSERTIETRRERLGRLDWFLRHRELPSCGLPELRAFFHYLNHGHAEPGGRWGNPRMTKPLSSGRAKSYHSTLRTFFNWLVEEGEIDANPMARIPPPVDRPDQVQPFTDAQLKALIAAAKKGQYSPRRDEAIVLLLLDTGMRASELCALACGDADLQGCQCLIRTGKGGKSRAVPFSRETRRALYHYLNEREWEADAPLFLSERGITASDGLTRFGLKQLVARLGRAAKIEGARCSPHTFRHSFAIGFLRAGGNVFTLQQMLGHTSLAMTNRYVAVAEADVANQHRQFSPVARLNRQKGGRP